MLKSESIVYKKYAILKLQLLSDGLFLSYYNCSDLFVHLFFFRFTFY